MGLKKKIEPDPKEKVAKVATRNRQNRHLAEFRQSSLTKVVEHQILTSKMVLQPKIRSPSQKND